MLYGLFSRLNDAMQGKPCAVARSGKWPKVRDEHLQKFPTCAACGGKSSLVVHHLRPFHCHPELELDPNNLLTLCEDGIAHTNDHIIFGHSGDYKAWSLHAIEDAARMLSRIKSRKYLT